MVEDRVVLVTGATSGFGRETATILSSHGYRVFGTSRRQLGNQEGVEMLQLEISSDESAKSCVADLINKAGRVDVLVNNAGQVITGGVEETSIAEAKAHFDTNLFGAVRMVNAVLPEMRRRRSGQIINVASVAGTFPAPFEGYYGMAKAALMAYSEVLRAEAKALGIKVSVVEPGFFKTNLAGSRVKAANSIGDYDRMREKAHRALEESFDGGGNPKEVAETILRIVRSPSPRLHYIVGREKRFVLLKRIMPESVMESQLRKHWHLDD